MTHTHTHTHTRIRERDRRTDMTHRQTDLKTSVRSGPALVGGRTDKQCTQVLSKLCFCCLQTHIAHKNCTHVFFSHKFIRSNPAQMGGWIDQILNNKICSRPTLGSSKQAASKPLIVPTEQLVVLLADWPSSHVAQADEASPAYEDTFNRRASPPCQALRPLTKATWTPPGPLVRARSVRHRSRNA